MRVTHVALDDFRSYRHVVVELPEGVTVLGGPNGQGKTNLVEAIAYLSTFSSHRVAAEGALVRLPGPDGEAPGGAVIRVKVRHGGDEAREQVLELELVRGRANRARLNRTQVRPRDILGMVRTVVFAPEDLQIVRGDPSVRRTFLDELAVQTKPLVAQVRADFDKVARQRAALIKTAQSQMRRGRTPELSTLEVWDAQFAQLSARLTSERHRVVEMLREPAARAHDRVADSPRALVMSLEASIDRHDPGRAGDPHDLPAQTERLIDALREVREREVERGINLVGAHRDDLALELGGMPVKGYASHGETWSVCLALRLGSFEALRVGEDAPILILDDVFAELDARRRRGLASLVADAEQVIVTAAVPEDVPEELRGTLLRVRADAERGSLISPGGTDAADVGA